MNHRLILKGKDWLRAVYANMALPGSWNVNAFWPRFSEISKWTWRTVSEEITTKELPQCGGDLHWGTAEPSAIPEWALRQVSRRSLVKQAANQRLWYLAMFTAELSRRRRGAHVSHPCVYPHKCVTVTWEITWPESRVRGELSEHFEICAVFIQIAFFEVLWLLGLLYMPSSCCSIMHASSVYKL